MVMLLVALGTAWGTALLTAMLLGLARVASAADLAAEREFARARRSGG
jgi:hypothetical protein